MFNFNFKDLGKMILILVLFSLCVGACLGLLISYLI